MTPNQHNSPALLLFVHIQIFENVVVLLFIASSAETDWEEDQDATVRNIWRPSWLVPSPIVILSTATEQAGG